ncbi:MAG: glycosyltransferase family 4 protein [Janthinobacterium lividum]
MSVVFINHPLETWTPTSSGALATIIWQCCRVAEKEAQHDAELPWVITRSSEAARFPWAQTIVLDPPALPASPFAIKALRAERKLTGWRHLSHRAYAFQVMSALKRQGLQNRPLVLINDPEMTVYLRRHFPKATILHWFQNQLEASPRFRSLYPEAADVTAGVSDFTSRWIADYYKIGSVPTIYNGVDLEQFTPSTVPAKGLPAISFVGRTGIEKAPDLLLKAALMLSERTKDFRVLMIGSNHWDRLEMDDYQQELVRLANTLEERGIFVERPGHVSRPALPGVLRSAQIHVVPSRWDEPFGLTTVEGMASGLAIAASRTGGTSEIIGDSGFLFERDNAGQLADCLEQLVCDGALRFDYAKQARNRAEDFPWEATWRQLNGLLGQAKI